MHLEHLYALHYVYKQKGDKVFLRNITTFSMSGAVLMFTSTYTGERF